MIEIQTALEPLKPSRIRDIKHGFGDLKHAVGRFFHKSPDRLTMPPQAVVIGQGGGRTFTNEPTYATEDIPEPQTATSSTAPEAAEALQKGLVAQAVEKINTAVVGGKFAILTPEQLKTKIQAEQAVVDKSKFPDDAAYQAALQQVESDLTTANTAAADNAARLEAIKDVDPYGMKVEEITRMITEGSTSTTQKFKESRSQLDKMVKLLDQIDDDGRALAKAIKEKAVVIDQSGRKLNETDYIQESIISQKINLQDATAVAKAAKNAKDEFAKYCQIEAEKPANNAAEAKASEKPTTIPELLTMQDKLIKAALDWLALSGNIDDPKLGETARCLVASLVSSSYVDTQVDGTNPFAEQALSQFKAFVDERGGSASFEGYENLIKQSDVAGRLAKDSFIDQRTAAEERLKLTMERMKMKETKPSNVKEIQELLSLLFDSKTAPQALSALFLETRIANQQHWGEALKMSSVFKDKTNLIRFLSESNKTQNNRWVLSTLVNSIYRENLSDFIRVARGDKFAEFFSVIKQKGLIAKVKQFAPMFGGAFFMGVFGQLGMLLDSGTEQEWQAALGEQQRVPVPAG